MELAEALKEAKQQMSQAIYLCESSPGVYNTGLQSVYEKKSAMLSCLIYGIESLQAENEWLKASQPVRCGECSKYHKETGWCDVHSCFITSNGDFCHPWESNDWKMFGEDDYCSYGERRVEE